jgi:hypothetical protein
MKLQKIAGLGMLMSAAIGMLGVSSAQAQVTFTGTGVAAGDGENVAASATFNNVGGRLVLTLINTYTGSTFGNADTLTGVFFNGASGLTIANEQYAAGDVVYNFPTLPGTTISSPTTITPTENWAFTTIGGQSGIDGLQGGPANGIISAGFNPVPLHDGFTNGSHNPYVQDELIFTFTTALSLSSISDVNFLFGTQADTSDTIPGNGNSTPVPEASTVMAGALMLLPLGVGAIRALRKERAAVRIS